MILCEHDAVYTIGRKRGAKDNVLDPGETPVIEVERGGGLRWGMFGGGPRLIGGHPAHSFIGLLALTQ